MDRCLFIWLEYLESAFSNCSDKYELKPQENNIMNTYNSVIPLNYNSLS